MKAFFLSLERCASETALQVVTAAERPFDSLLVPGPSQSCRQPRGGSLGYGATYIEWIEIVECKCNVPAK